MSGIRNLDRVFQRCGVNLHVPIILAIVGSLLLCGNARGESVLNSALRSELVSLERAIKADPSALRVRASDGMDVLEIVAERGNLAGVRLLVRLGADVNAREPTGFTPLLWALQAEQPAVAQFLIEHGAKIDWFCAAAMGRIELLVRYLRENSKVIDSRAADMTALHIATLHDQTDTVAFLIDHNANIEARTLGDTALHLAAMLGKPKVLAVLLSHGASVNAVNGNGRTPAHLAVSAGVVTTLEILKRSGANLCALDNRGFTPCTFTGDGTPLSIVKFFVENGAVQASEATEIAVRAAATGNVSVLEYLLNNHVTVNVRDASGGTLLHAAVEGHQAGSVRQLLLAGADPTARDMQGKTPVDLARESNQNLILALLTNRMLSQ
jgi:ankyrin repeat protein